mmetsp:Transcript_101206/g.241310  ORF Transcript_101206/g.241310 Transcript_101206/m.241310 type:complete len:222 (+) Transcript_101206:266-931(+)
MVHFSWNILERLLASFAKFGLIAFVYRPNQLLTNARGARMMCKDFFSSQSSCLCCHAQLCESRIRIWGLTHLGVCLCFLLFLLFWFLHLLRFDLLPRPIPLPGFETRGYCAQGHNDDDAEDHLHADPSVVILHGRRRRCWIRRRLADNPVQGSEVSVALIGQAGQLRRLVVDCILQSHSVCGPGPEAGVIHCTQMLHNIAHLHTLRMNNIDVDLERGVQIF